MVYLYKNTVASVFKPPSLLIFIDENQKGWCQQFSEEGYNVIHVAYKPFSPTVDLAKNVKEALHVLAEHDTDWGLIAYGLQSGDLPSIVAALSPKALQDLKACIHFCPNLVDGQEALLRYTSGLYIPSIFHLSSSQENFQASLAILSDPTALGYTLPTSAYHPITVHSYPKVPANPPFPFLMKAPALVTAGEKSSADPYIRSATGVSYTRTLELLKRALGPHYDFERLWERHTYYEFVERDAPKTMSTMVATPYVNHIATMTGGVGYEHLARFYKYHFTGENVTPPDTELITVSRTVGADRVIDEMIFKCTHTTENDYFLPGIKPTGKPLEIAVVGVVAFRGDKLTFEYWDQASVLVQLGLLDPTNLPVAGVEVARKVVDPFGLPSNTLMERWRESEGLSID
ncbi:unnamed protein product [Somion occarium]|uniref:NTF2-like protein n=1 Tax=Somion occarium TaxID=3059160 RepID=A0ABP1CKR1_9APHY